MTSSRRSQLSAVLVFALIALVVVGGIGWATASTIELAKYNVAQEFRTRVHRATWQLDSYVGGIMYSEAAREYTDYVAFHAREPIAGIRMTGEAWEADSRYVMLPSSILKGGPPHDWIDLYFQIEHGVVASPQVPEDQWTWVVDSLPRHLDFERRARRARDWLQARLARIDLPSRAVRTPSADTSFPSKPGGELRPGRTAQHIWSLGESTRAASARELQNRARTLRDPQLRHVPLPVCETRSVVERNIPQMAADRVPNDRDSDDRESVNFNSGHGDSDHRDSVHVDSGGPDSNNHDSDGRGQGAVGSGHGPESVVDTEEGADDQFSTDRAGEEPNRAVVGSRKLDVADGPGAGWNDDLTRIEVSLGMFAPPFWMEGPPGEGRKLVFVRECSADMSPFYQGFVGDWTLLKTELLKQVSGQFPGTAAAEIDLIPVDDETEVSADLAGFQLSQLPVYLDVPEAVRPTLAAAWWSVSGVLVTTWLAAVVVLGIAGWGVRNLVALTERRMQFAYAVTHELRTPLTTFRLYADMLSSGLVPEDQRAKYLETLNREGERLATLVESVLEYARLENQRVPLQITETSGDGLLSTLRPVVERSCEESGIEARFHNDVPSGVVVRTDVEVVKQVAGVLVNNACRHTRGRSPAVVHLGISRTDGSLHVDVADSGPGVDRADTRVIFKPFRRGRGAAASGQGGIGLGLALARGWASLLNGQLELVSRHDETLGGARFRLTVPLSSSV